MKVYNVLLILIFILSSNLVLYGQTGGEWTASQIDSLKRQASNQSMASDTNFDIYKEVVLYYTKVQVDSMSVWAEKGKSLAIEGNNKKMEGWFDSMIAESLYHKAKFTECKNEFLSLLPIYESDIEFRANAYAWISRTFLYNGAKDSVVYYALEAHDLFVELKDTTKQIQTLYALFQVQNQLNNLSASKEYLDQAKELVFKTKAEFWYGTTFLNSGNYHYYVASQAAGKDSLLYATSLDSSLHYYTLAYEVYTQKKAKRFMAASLANIGLVYKAKFEWKKALRVFEDARDLSIEFNNPHNTNSYNSFIASCWSQLGEPVKAIPFLKECVKYFKENGSPESLGDSYYNLSIAYEKNGDWKNAFITKNLQLETNRAVFDSLTIRQVNELEAKYELVDKEKQIAEQELALLQSNSKSRLLTGSIVATILIGGLIFWFNQRQSKIKSALQTAEIQTLKQENKLIAMQGILSGQEEERKRIAQDLHDNIGTLMTTIKIKVLDIQKSIADVAQINIAGEIDDMIGQASSEIRRISHNMTPVAMDLTGLAGAIEDLSTQLQANGVQSFIEMKGLDQIKDKQKEVILYRIIQELVNNIGKHANARNVQLRSAVDGKTLVIEISDDGDGMDKAQWNNGNGLGVKSIKSRVEYLEGTIEMKNNNGTHFKIQIPI